ncbi:MAG: T9SS type A sorting domain-containing protein [Flavobacterium sp.]|nr:T9SS type A sorting domain-containing protein [Pedobacter sp.]
MKSTFTFKNNFIYIDDFKLLLLIVTGFIICLETASFINLRAGYTQTFQNTFNPPVLAPVSSITWSTVASQPFSVSEAQGEVVNGKLYSFGGFDSQKACCTPTNRVLAYDPSVNSWTALASMPAMNGTPFGGVTHSGFTNDGIDIYFAGGYTSNTAGTGQIFGTREAWKYVISQNTYVRLPDLPVTISAGQLEFLNGKLHHIGGTNASRTTDLGDHYVLDLTDLNAGWTTSAPLPTARHHSGSAVYNNQIYYIGGQMGHDATLVTNKEVHRYDEATNTWTKMADLLVPAGTNGRGHISSAAVVYNDKIIVLGGETAHSVPTDMVSVYDPATNIWQNSTSLPTAKRSGKAGIINSNIYYSGGGSSTTYKGVAFEPLIGGCAPLSTLDCGSITVAIPFNLDFTSPITNSIADKNALGIGFTMVNPYAGIRVAADGSPTNPSVPGYEASKLTLTNGVLQLVTNKGIFSRTENNQLNALGVRVDSRNKLQIDVSLINPFNGTSFQQGGIWFGIDDKTFIKLVVTGNKVEMLREINDNSSNLAEDQRVTAVINSLNTQTVRLRLLIDPVTNTAESFYSTDGINFINVGEMYSTKSVNISGMGMTSSTAFGGVYGTHRNSSTPVTYNFDNFGISGTATVPEPTTPCYPISTLPCSAIQVNLPLSLNFDQPKANTITDINNQGIGFTMVDAYSGTRLAADGTPPNVNVPGYEPSKLTLGNGQMQIVSQKGIAYLTNNNQINSLGVQFNSQVKYQVETEVINPFNGTSAQQAGIWIGQNDKTFLKLVVVGNNLEFRKELNDVSASADNKVSVLSGLSTKTVKLRIVVDPATNIADAFYSIDGNPYTLVGGAGLSISGMALTGSTAFAGIFATHRNSSTPVTYTFDNFGISNPAVAPPPPPVAVNPGAYMVIENRDQNFPAADHLVFSKIQVPWNGKDFNTPYNYNHNKVTLRINNKGTSALTVNNLTFSKTSLSTAWKIVRINSDSTAALPISVASRGFADVVIEFIALNEATRVKTIHDTLYVSSGDPSFPLKKVMLHGNWQYKGEGGNEPRAQEIINTFAFKTRTGFSSSDGSTNRGTVIVPNSDEIISSFFIRANTAKPVTVTQMAAFHSCCATRESFAYYVKGSLTNTSLFAHYAEDGQSILPRFNATTAPTAPVLARRTFNPTSAFGLKIGTANSDRTRNFEGKIGMRIWKAVDPNGNIIPNAYIIGNDYLGTTFTNYDYQDNIYYIENVRPEEGTAYYSELGALPSSVSFANVNTGLTGTMSANIKNLGTSYVNGSNDPSITIQRVQIVGPNAAEFSASMPSVTSLGVQATTGVPLQFSPTSPGIKNAALLVFYNNSRSPLRIPLYGISNSNTVSISNFRRIKSSSNSSVVIGGQTWEADINFRIGNAKFDVQNPMSDVAGTDDDVLYQTYLSSNANFDEMRYEIPIANGNYMIRMHHVENVWQAAGLRVFNVSIENQLKFSFLDIFKEVGYRAAIVKDYETTVADGVLSLKFNPSADRLAISGIEIFSVTGGPALTSQSIEKLSTTLLPGRLALGSKILRTYPNPNNGDRIFVDLENFGVRENVTIQMHDIMGRLIKTMKGVTDNHGRLNAELVLGMPLNKEIYIIKASSQSGTKQSKIIIE